MSYYTKYLKYKKKYINLQKGGMLASIVSSTKDIYNWFSTPSKLKKNGTITLANGDIHSGDFVNDNLTNGTITLAKGIISTYKGRFSDGRLLEGIVSYNSGEIKEIEGIFNDGPEDIIIRLIKGTVTFTNGDIYSGDFVNGNLTNGTITLAKGTISTYKGRFSNNQLVEGKVLYNAGEIKEIGGIFDGKSEDPIKRLIKGTVTFTNGDIHSGDFHNGVLNLKTEYTVKFKDGFMFKGIDNKDWSIGTYTDADEIKEGYFAKDTFNIIKGKITFIESGIIYETKEGGIFIKDKLNGPGKIDNNESKTIQEGNFHDGILNQKTEYTIKFKDDFMFKGIDNKDLRIGTYTDANKIKEGYFTKDTFNIIKGKITFIESGIIYETKEEGIFIKDKLNGPGKIHNNESKTIQEGNFHNGVLKNGIFIFIESGIIYETKEGGIFIEDKLNGPGKEIITIPKSKFTREGNFENGFLKTGIIIREGIKGIETIECENFNLYKPTGTCTIKFADGTVYTNNFIDGNIEGVQTKDIEEQEEYNLILYINGHGCDVKDDYLPTFDPHHKIKLPNFKKYINMKYASAVDYNHSSSVWGDIDIDLYYVIALINNGGELDQQINKYQTWKGRINPKLSIPNYNHLYTFDEEGVLEPQFGIYIIKNDLGLPNYVNIFDFTKPNYINENVKELSENMAKLLRYNRLSLKNFQKGIYEWFEIVRNGGEKKLNLTLIDSSCRNYCDTKDEVKSSLP